MPFVESHAIPITHRTRMKIIAIIALTFLASSVACAQPTGANRPEVDWYRFDTDHFTIIYHTGLDSAAREAANVAEAIYPVVTGNLRREVSGRTPLYLSDLDDIPNAFASDDRHMFIWMRGILDDMPLGGIRSAGRSKWFRSVITHEFTHIVVAHATKTLLSNVVWAPRVPRWFNEGTARFMEPDPWTTDIDMVLRVAAVNARLDYGSMSGRLDGTLLYETGHSLVRYMTWRFGDSTLALILNGGRTMLGYNFEKGVYDATGMSMSEIHRDWLRTVTTLYGAEYAVREETSDITKPLIDDFDFIPAVRVSHDRRRIALLTGGSGEPLKLYLAESKQADKPDERTIRLLTDETGFDTELSWNPSGTSLVVSKQRLGTHYALIRDLYIIDATTGDLRRLTSDAALTDPAWSPDGTSIVAVEKRMGRDNLVLVDPESGLRSPLTRFTADVQMYTPSWSPDSRRIAVSLFDEQGNRAIAVVNRDGTGFTTLTADSANNRYPVWSPDGARIAFTSHANGIPNIQIMNADGTDWHFVTDVAGGLYSVQWMPGADSIVAISFDSRDEIVPHLIPAGRRVTPVPRPQIREKYMAWQSVRLPRQVPPAGEIQTARRDEPRPHWGITALEPIVPIAPVAATDRSADGSSLSARIGAGTFWTDPMDIHSVGLYVDYGLASREPGGEFFYINNTFRPQIIFRAEHTLEFEKIVADVPYHQRTSGAGVTVRYAFADRDRVSYPHSLAFGAHYRHMTPWNLEQFASFGVEPARMPVAADLMELAAVYRYVVQDAHAAVRYVRSEPMLGSSIEYHRLSADLAAEVGIPFGFTLLGRAAGTAQWGAQLPQEFIGLNAYDQLEGGINPTHLIDSWKLAGNYRVRGVRRYMFGEKVAVASLGLRTRLGINIVESFVPIVRMLQPDLVFFAEAGSAWDGERGAGNPIVAGYGAELQASLFGFGFATGIAFEMKEKPHRDIYLRLMMGL